MAQYMPNNILACFTRNILLNMSWSQEPCKLKKQIIFFTYYEDISDC